MKIDAVYLENSSDIVILRPKGKITIGVGDVALRETVREEIDKGHRNVILNMKGVSTVDSSGLGELVSAFTQATSSGGFLRFVDRESGVIDRLKNTVYGIDDLFITHAEEQDAIRAFEEGSLPKWLQGRRA